MVILNLSRSTLLMVLTIITSLYLLTKLFRALFSPLRHVPGPFLARFTRLWYLRAIMRGDFHKTNIMLHRKYGPIVRIAPQEYSVDDASAVNIIYGHGTKFAKSAWYFASGSPDPHAGMSLFSEQDSERHSKDRRKVASLYSMTSLLKMESGVDECITKLSQSFNDFAFTGKVVNMQHWLQCYAFDVIGKITLDERFGFLDNGEDIGGVFNSIHSYLVYCAHVGVYSEWHPIISACLSKLSAGGMNHMTEFTEYCIRRRLQETKETDSTDGGDFLTKVLNLHKQAPEAFSMTDVLSVCATNIGAGSDTTSVSLSAILYNLIKHPTAMSKLRQELLDGVAEGTVTSPMITFQQAQNLPYLRAVINEGLRLHPATGLPLGRVVPEPGVTIANTFFPAGSVVGINTWTAHASTMIFGSDAEDFRPERWLESEKETSRLSRYWLPFGAGSRTCIGKNISLLEISKLIPYLVLNYDFSLENMGPEGMNTQNVWFVKPTNFKCRIRTREKV